MDAKLRFPFLVLSRRDVTAPMPSPDYAGAVADAFRRHPVGRTLASRPMHILVEGGGFHAKARRQPTGSGNAAFSTKPHPGQVRTFDHADTTPSHGNVSAWPSILLAQIRKGLRMNGRWIVRANRRTALADLDDHLLRDVGVSRMDARRAWDKPVWKPRISHEGWSTPSIRPM